MGDDPVAADRMLRNNLLARLQEDKKIAITRHPLSRAEDHTHAVVWVYGVQFMEPLEIFPSEAIIATVLLSLACGGYDDG